MLFKKSSEKYSKIYYVIEDADWSIKWDGLYITSNLEKLFKIKSTIITDF